MAGGLNGVLLILLDKTLSLHSLLGTTVKCRLFMHISGLRSVRHDERAVTPGYIFIGQIRHLKALMRRLDTEIPSMAVSFRHPCCFQDLHRRRAVEMCLRGCRAESGFSAAEKSWLFVD